MIGDYYECIIYENSYDPKYKWPIAGRLVGFSTWGKISDGKGKIESIAIFDDEDGELAIFPMDDYCCRKVKPHVVDVVLK